VDVESDCTDSVVALKLCGFRCAGYGCFGTLVVFEAAEGIVSETGGFALFSLLQPFALAVEDEFGIQDERHAVRMGKFFGSGANEVHMLTFLKDQARGLNGIAKAFYAGNTAGLHAAAVHQESVELNATVRGEKAAAPRVESGIVFQYGDSGLDGVDSCSTVRQDSEAGLKSFAHTGLVCCGSVIWNGPCSTVNDQDGFVCGISHPLMVVDEGRAGNLWR
jgi:hypothetical protein